MNSWSQKNPTLPVEERTKSGPEEIDGGCIM